ncbi:uncharacterized protein LOC105433439 [Pogonomyrmex barbatus]|uniref:Uncharacterized protein LOC105433439 n=1 Tax=Pogonomyrmex barbatus TaxID=144034 RepID=A0A6I9WWL4_9HYME|nr:uncharacterized protein LOC105433439 [Pogonomyrmex barbatus]
MRKLKSFERLRPMEQAFYYLSSILSEKFFTYEEILKASAYITIEETKKFINMFIHKIYIECFIYGNMNEEQALNIARNLEFDMVILNNVQMCTRNELEPHRVIKLDKGM